MASILVNIEVALFWFFAVATVVGFIIFIAGFILNCYFKESGYKAVYIIGIIIFLVFGLVCFGLLGTLGYKPYLKDKFNRIIHFGSREVKLQKKAEELSGLREQLKRKQEEVKQLLSEYQSSINSLANEIKNEQKANRIQSFEQAQKHPRISYDLSLIQRKKAYIDKLQETEVKLQYGTYELEFLERQAVDDLKMVKTLDNKEVDKLIGDINNVIEKYLPDSGKLVVEVDPNSMQTPRQIWEQIQH